MITHKETKEKKDFSTMDTITIGLIDGDGIGPVIMEQAVRVLRKLLADDIASTENIRVMHGVYVGTAGPTFETPAEYEFFRVIGGDAVGMSTVPEVIVANHASMEVLGISVITDLGGKDITDIPTHEEVQKAAMTAQPNMVKIMQKLITQL